MLVMYLYHRFGYKNMTLFWKLIKMFKMRSYYTIQYRPNSNYKEIGGKKTIN